MKDSLKFGFLILNYNSWNLTCSLAAKVAKYKLISKVVIVDNCSTDDSLIHINNITGNKIISIKSEKNGGYAYGNNFGVLFCEKIGLDAVFISNPDVDIEEKDINEIIMVMINSDYAVLSGVELNKNFKVVYPPIWKPMNYLDDLLDCFFLGRRLFTRKHHIELNINKRVQCVEITKGSFMAVRLKDFLGVGGFDENTFLFCEERILAKRMSMCNKKMGIVPSAKYVHNHSETINQEFTRKFSKVKMLYESRLYFYDNYSNLSRTKRLILLISMKFSLLEYLLMDCIVFLKGKKKIAQ